MWSSTVSNTGDLNIYIYNTQTLSYTKMWTLSKSQGTSWKEGSFSYSASSTHKLVFEGVRALGIGDFALDDITLLESTDCAFFPSIATPVTGPTTTVTSSTFSTTTRTTTTTYTWVQQSQYDCNFEVDFCQWKIDTTAKFNWTRKSGSTPSYLTGPSFDHTYGTTATGFYIFVETSVPQKYGDRCRIESPEIQGDKCIEFYYHMFGADVDTLNIYLKQNNLLGSPVWSRIKNQGNLWRRGEYRIRGVSNSYKIVFEGVVGGSWEGVSF
jgi:hypothetical protein